MTRNLEREVDELKSEIKRLSESADRRAWGNPHEFVYRALGAVELIRSYHASSGPGVQMIRDLVEILRNTAAGRAGQQYAGAAFIYGAAELIEGAYLSNRYHEELHAYAVKKRMEEKSGRPSQQES